MATKLIKEKKIALREIRKGATLAAAAERAGVSSALVCLWTQDAGLLPGRKQKTAKIQKLLRVGKMSVNEIAATVQVSRVTVYAQKRKMILILKS